MRIAHVTATFPPYQGGTGNVCYYNCRELARLGHQVVVFTAAVPGAPELEWRDGFTVHRLRPLLRFGNAPVLPGLVRALNGFDVIHLHYPFVLGAEMVRLASALHRTPFVVSLHNDLIGVGSRSLPFALYQRLSAAITVGRSAGVCAVSMDHYLSSGLRRAIGRDGPPAAEVPNGVDLSLFRPDGPPSAVRERYAIPAGARLILFVAALDRAHHFKGLELLLEALTELPPTVWLLAAGDGDMRLTYERRASELGIAQRVVFAGRVEHSDTPPLFRAADLTVLPSRPPESFGLVLIESLACGTPAVASEIPGVRTVVSHGEDGLLVESDNPHSLAKAIARMLADDDLRREMGARGRARVAERYDWRRVGPRLEAVYRQVAARIGEPQPRPLSIR